MNTMLPSLISTWGLALLNFLWQGLIIGVIAALLLRLFKQARPQVRYAISFIALLLCFLLPMSAVWRSSSLSSNSPVVSSITFDNTEQTVVTVAAFSDHALQNTLTNQTSWVVLLWLMGCLFFFLRMLLGLLWISRTRRHATANTDRALQSKLNVLAIQFGLQRPVDLLICNDIDGPVTAGWWKPMVLLPAALLTRLSPDLIEALIAHELAHIKRFDYLVNLIQSAIEAVLFFHPVVWWLSKQIRIERENIADDLAAEVLAEPNRLAFALAALNDFQATIPLLAPAAHGGNLMLRIKRLLTPNKTVIHWKLPVAVMALALVCLSVYAHEKISSNTNALSIPAVASLTPPNPPAPPIPPAPPMLLTPPSPPAPPAPPTPPTAPRASHTETFSSSSTSTVYHNAKNQQESYALVIDGKKGMMISGNTDDIKHVERTKKMLSGNFLWFRRNQNSFVVQDPGVIAKIQATWKDSDKLSAEMDAVGAQMDAHSKVMDSISSKMDDVSGNGDSQTKAMDKISHDMEVLGSKQEAIGNEMAVLGTKMADATTDAQRQALSSKMEMQSEKMARLSNEMEKLSALMETESNRLEHSLKPLEALSKEMEMAAKPLEPLGKQMGELGKQMDVLVKKADKEVMRIIDEAIKNGQAVPIDSMALK